VAEVDVGNALEEGVALHDLVVEMRKGEGRGGIDDEGEPEAEAGDVDGAALDVNTVDVVANDVALEVGGGARGVQKRGEGGAAGEEQTQEAHGEGAGADGGVANLDVGQGAVYLFGKGGGELLDVVRFDEGAQGVGVDTGEGGDEMGEEALATHVANDFFGGVEGALVFVVFEQILEDAAEHFGVYAHFGVVGVVFVDGEVVFGEHLEEVAEEFGREAGGEAVEAVALEESAAEPGDAHGADVPDLVLGP